MACLAFYSQTHIHLTLRSDLTLGQKHTCVFQVSRPYLGFGPAPQHCIVNSEQNIVKYAENGGKCSEKCNIRIKCFDKIK